MAGKDIFQYNLNRSEKVKTLPITTSVKLSSKDEATFFSGISFQKLVALGSGCNISFDDCKGHEPRVYPPALFEHGDIILNRINNSVFLRLKIY